MKRSEGQISTAETTVHKRRGKYTHREPKLMAELMQDAFNPAQMSAGYKRGMVLSICKDKIRQVVGNERFLGDLEYAILSGGNKQEYIHPVLTLHFKSGSIWPAEMKWHTGRLKEMINERLKCDFLKDVKVK